MNAVKTEAPEMLTFVQYVDAQRRNAAARYALTMAEARRELPDHRYTAEWRKYIVRTFNEGGTISTRMWRSFDEGLQYRILRSPRALRSDALTRELRAKGLTHA